MPREPLVTGEIYHVYNHGVDDRQIFMREFDIRRFLACMDIFNTISPVGSLHDQLELSAGDPRFIQRKHQAARNNDPLVSLLAYNLLGNHFHFLLMQCVDGGISEFMRRMGIGHTHYYNEQYGRRGPLYEGKFKSIYVGKDAYLNYLMAYISYNEVVHNFSFLFSVSTEVQDLCSSRKQYQEGSSGLSDLSILTEYVQDTAFWRDAKKLARSVHKQRDADKLLLE